MQLLYVYTSILHAKWILKYKRKFNLRTFKQLEPNIDNLRFDAISKEENRNSSYTWNTNIYIYWLEQSSYTSCSKKLGSIFDSMQYS